MGVWEIGGAVIAAVVVIGFFWLKHKEMITIDGWKVNVGGPTGKGVGKRGKS